MDYGITVPVLFGDCIIAMYSWYTLNCWHWSFLITSSYVGARFLFIAISELEVEVAGRLSAVWTAYVAARGLAEYVLLVAQEV